MLTEGISMIDHISEAEEDASYFNEPHGYESFLYSIDQSSMKL